MIYVLGILDCVVHSICICKYDENDLIKLN